MSCENCKNEKDAVNGATKESRLMTDMLRRVVTEIYHLCGSEKERAIVRGLKSKMP